MAEKYTPSSFEPVEQENGYTPSSFEPVVDGSMYTPSSFEPVKLEDKGVSVGGMAKQFGIGFGNAAIMGAPLAAVEKYKGKEAIRQLESGNPIERISRGVGTTIGTLTPVPAKIFGLGVKVAQAATKAIKGVEGAKKMNKFAKAAIETGAGAGAYEIVNFNTDFKEKQVTVPTAIMFGAATGPAIKALEPKFQALLGKKNIIKDDYIQTSDDLKKLNDVIKGPVEAPESVKLNIKNFGNSIETSIVDKYSPIRHIQEGIEQVIKRPIEFEKDAYKAARLYPGVFSKIDSKLNDLKSAVGINEPYLKQMEQIMAAERMIERSSRNIDNPGGITLDQAKKSLDEIKAVMGEPLYNQVYGSVSKIRSQLDDTLKESIGTLISPEQYANIKANNQFYTPFEVLKHMADDLDSIPRGSGFRATTPGALKAVIGTTNEINRPMDSVIHYITKLTQSIEGQKVRSKIVGLRELDKGMEDIIIPISKDISIPEGFKKISVFKNGVKEEYAVPAVLSDVVDGLNKESADFISKVAASTGRFLREGATSLSLPFSLSQLPRDIIQAKFTSPIGYGLNDWGRGFTAAITKNKLYDEWLRSGGAFSNYQSVFGRNKISKTEQLFTPLSDKILNVTNPLTWLRKAAEISEQSTRVGVFSRAKRMGLSLPEAAYISRNSTVDFARQGTKMQIANMWVPFLNARTQGTLNVLESAQKNPKKFALLATSLIGMPATSTYFWNKQNYPDVYDTIPQYYKDNNFMFIYGREKDQDGKWLNVLSIPKGDIGKVLGNPLENFYEWTFYNRPQNFAEIATKIADNISPVSVTNPLSSITPPVVKAGLEAKFNKNMFTGNEIVPQQLKNASPRQQYKDTTAPIAVAIGDLFNVSPLKIENTFSTVGGSFGRMILSPTEPAKTFKNKFIGAPYQINTQEKERIFNSIVEETENQDAKNYRLVRQAIKELPTIAQQDVQTYIRNKFSRNEKAFKTFIDMQNDINSGVDWIDKQIRQRPYEDRIKFIKEYSEYLDTNEERLEFMGDAFKKKLLTDDGIKRYIKRSTNAKE